MRNFWRSFSVLLLVVTLIFSGSCARGETVQTHGKYYYALVNLSGLTMNDCLAIDSILNSYSEHEIYLIDVSDCANAGAVYEKLASDHSSRPGVLDGIQIFGTSDMVPAFWLDDKVQMADSYHTDRAFASDYFYSNFHNNPADLMNFNLADCFAEGKNVDFQPLWRVARLALGSGEFAPYAENYANYLSEQAGASPVPVCFCNPIFGYRTVAVDDMAHFLSRATTEWGFLSEAHLYGNQQGDYPCKAGTLGDCTETAMRAENKATVCEFYLTGHGNRSEVLRTVWEGGKRTTTTLLNWGNVSSVLGAKPYFMNLWSCGAARGMDFNFTRTALTKGCLGAFAATANFSNNGVDCAESAEKMSKSGNFFYFYYSYLQAKKNGATRSAAFLAAQQNMNAALGALAGEPVDFARNYQLAYGNLLCYANLGILEPDAGEIALVPATGWKDVRRTTFCTEHLFVTTGNPVGEAGAVSSTAYTSTGVDFATVKKVSAVGLDNGHIRFTIDVTLKQNASVYLLQNEKTPLLNQQFHAPKNNGITILVDVAKSDLKGGAFLLLFRAANDAGVGVWRINGFQNLYNS